MKTIVTISAFLFLIFTGFVMGVVWNQKTPETSRYPELTQLKRESQIVQEVNDNMAKLIKLRYADKCQEVIITFNRDNSRTAISDMREYKVIDLQWVNNDLYEVTTTWGSRIRFFGDEIKSVRCGE